MLRFYAIQPLFYETMRQHAMLLRQIHTLSKQQQEVILLAIEQAELTQSALSFFQSAIYEKGNELMFDTQISQGTCRVCRSYVELDNKRNPFYELLCRKYPCHVALEME